MQGGATRKRGRPRGSSTGEGGATTVQALDRGLQILNVLAKEGQIALTDLAMRVGLPASSAHRLLMTLEKHGYAEFYEEDQTWRIGVEAFRTGSSFLGRTNVVEAGREVMHKLMVDTGETCNIAIADKGDVVFVSQVETHEPIRAFFRQGTRGPMHASGIGKALLAEMSHEEVEQLLHQKGLAEFTETTITAPDKLFKELETIHQRGWSLDDEERTPGMRCVAAPIFNEFGEAVAGISISGPTVRLGDKEVSEVWPKVVAAADHITSLVGGRKPKIERKKSA